MPENAGGRALALVASPREGNTRRAVRDLLSAFSCPGRSGDDEVDLDTLNLLPIGDCQACLAAGVCSRKDDFDKLMQRIFRTDLLILATPLYWYGPSAQMKVLIDRWSCLLDRDETTFREHMRGKRVVLLVAQGEQGFYESQPCLQMLEWTIRYLHMVIACRVVVVGHARDDYESDDAQRRAVRAVGAALAASPTTPDLFPAWSHVPHVPGSPLGGVFKPSRPMPNQMG